ncbi:MAG: hypothetical protein ACFCBW_07075 [Candidatus Competibacterales bacterium]
MSDLVAEIHPRAAAKVLEFAQVLADHRAVFAAEFEGERVQFERVEQIQQVVAALRPEDMNEAEVETTGTILGILPKARAFEAQLVNSEVIQRRRPLLRND